MMRSSNGSESLPKGWAQCSIGQITLPTTKIDPRVDIDRKVQYIDISSVDNVRHVIGDTKRYKLRHAPSRARQLVRSGDTLFATVRPYLRNIARVPSYYDQEIASTGFSVLRPAVGVCPEFLFYRTISNDFVDRISKMQYGVSYPAVKDEQVRDQRLWLPPTAEQHRIVAKIDELFSELDTGIENLKKALTQLSTYRRAVLKHAFEGKLTAQWREANKDTLETSEQLFARIKSQRSVRYERQLRDWQAAVDQWEKSTRGGRGPAKPKRPRDVSIAYTICDAGAHSGLPYGWRWVRLGNIAEVSGGVTKSQKRNVLPRKIKYLRVANVYADRILSDDVHEIGVTEAEAKNVALRYGDLLVVEGNGSIEQIGRVAMWQGEIVDCGHQNHLIRVRTATEHDPQFMLRFLLSPLGRDLIMKEASSTSGLHTLSISKVEKLPVPVASFAEETEVVFQIDHELAIVDKSVDEIEAQLVKSRTLRQSILNKAFSGELVPQDATDEPASVLLDRIRAEREQTAKRAGLRKTAKRKTGKVTP